MTPLTKPLIKPSNLLGIINVIISTGKNKQNIKNTIIKEVKGFCTTILVGANALINL